MARNYRAIPVWIPGTVVKQNGSLSYFIQVNGGQLWRRHINQLRERKDTPREHPVEDQHPQVAEEDAAVWSNPRSPSTVTNQDYRNESVSGDAASDKQQPEGLTQTAQPIISTPPVAEPTSQTATTHTHRYPQHKRTLNKKYL